MDKKKKCPYCGKRISYFSSYFSRRKAEFVCPRCKKESRVVINKFVILAFVICALISVAVMVLWLMLGYASNPLGILLVAIPLIVFALISPRFVRYEPLKKYKKSMEARKAGIEYSDNLLVSEIDDTGSTASYDSGAFHINSDIFNEIKAERSIAKEQAEQNEIISDSSSKLGSTNVYDIENVRENHAVSDAPLKRIRPNRSRHYIDADVSETVSAAEQDDLEDIELEPRKPEGNRYSANRKF